MADQSGSTPPDELALKQPLWTSTNVEARLSDTFSSEDRHFASVLLAGLMGEDPGGDPEVSDLATCRLMLAAIKVSEGDLAKLSLWVAAAREDPRDLIAAAEYRRRLQDEGAQADEADLAEYLVWVADQ
jgi:hypothetical protein